MSKMTNVGAQKRPSCLLLNVSSDNVKAATNPLNNQRVLGLVWFQAIHQT
ncbi:hypothetical protein IQ22_04625 [Pseudomonas duriflava]|uniref:Uncharacterized protein n=1 Tax=Pseudomonas duriflava TaxID=459528 RepID=A0A562PM41_9PSED|nr:hypothetical protein IQ22_04625 [Pseudomonas duriflava]